MGGVSGSNDMVGSGGGGGVSGGASGSRVTDVPVNDLAIGGASGSGEADVRPPDVTGEDEVKGEQASGVGRDVGSDRKPSSGGASGSNLGDHSAVGAAAVASVNSVTYDAKEDGKPNSVLKRT